MKHHTKENDKLPIDISKNRYPYCIVWNPLPFITALLPFIGHIGICTSEGIIHDFSSSYTVSVDDMAFGNPTKYVELDFENKEIWDECIRKGDDEYRKMFHNIICNNCHSHVAYVLNKANFQGGGWNMVNIASLVTFKSKYTGISGFLKTYIGFVIAVCLVIWFFS